VTNLFRNSAVDVRLKAEFAIRESARAGGEELKEALSDASDPDL
jgi:hypothetical protein